MHTTQLVMAVIGTHSTKQCQCQPKKYLKNFQKTPFLGQSSPKLYYRRFAPKSPPVLFYPFEKYLAIDPVAKKHHWMPLMARRNALGNSLKELLPAGRQNTLW
jgi:hypothetical protein